MDEVLGLVAERALAMTGADGVAIGLAEGDSIICRGSAGIIAPDAGARLDPKSGFSGACIRTGQIVRCDDVETDPRVDLQACRGLDTRSVVAVPLYGRHAVVGLLEAFSRDAYAFNESDVRSLSLLAELIVAALKPEEELRLMQAARTAVQVSAEKPVIKPTVKPVEPRVESAPRPSPVPPRGRPRISDEPAFLVPSQSIFSSSPGLMVVAVVMVIAGLLAGGVYWKIRNTAQNAAIAATAGKSRPASDPAQVPSGTAPTGSQMPAATTQPDIANPGSEPNPTSAPTHTQDLSLSQNSDDNLQPSSRTDEENAAPPDTKLTVLPHITGVRHWSTANTSTIVIDLEDQVPYEVHRLSSPERIYFDLHDTILPASLRGKLIEVGDPQLNRVRIAQPMAGITRVVLDTKGGSNFSVSLEPNPCRLVVEVRGLNAEAQARPNPSTRTKERAESPATIPSPTTFDTEDAQLRAHVPRFRIVIDAGHGGWDLGTVGRKGLLEKDLVLDISQRLGQMLQSRLGTEVIYTRKDDAYISLDQRADVANQAQADLFVSIHANYSDLASARGVETYYTNFFSPTGSKEIEKRENGSANRTIVPAALSTEELQEKIEGSRLLATAVQRSLFNTLAGQNPSIRNRGVKRASFVVLTGTAMPAILAEVSFVSSPSDEEKLQMANYRQRIAEALYKGIARYATGSHRVKMASASGVSSGQ